MYTANLKALDAALVSLRKGLTRADDDLLELRDRERRLAALEDEGDNDLTAQYGLEN